MSYVETPQQNSIVERKHQYILNVARSLMFQSNVSLEYWGDCVLTAMYLINRTPSFVLSNKTPYEVLFGQLPSFSHLRVFGCLCYASTLHHGRHKFSSRANKCIFLGYPFGIKGYKVMDLNTHSIFISRDVQFHESIFPFHSPNSNFPSSSSNSDAPFTILPTHLDDENTTYGSLPTDITSFKPVMFPNTLNAGCPTSVSPSFIDLAPIDPHIPSLPDHTSLPLRKSTRVHKAPSYLQDYSCNLLVSKPSSGAPYDLNHYLSYANISTSHKAFVSATSVEFEPKFFHQVVGTKAWQEVMDKEISALKFNHTWDIVPLPSGKSPIGCKWVYRIKYNPDGSIARYKTRLVAKGYTQQEGLD